MNPEPTTDNKLHVNVTAEMAMSIDVNWDIAAGVQ